MRREWTRVGSVVVIVGALLSVALDPATSGLVRQHLRAALTGGVVPATSAARRAEAKARV
jgi:hypothetical protein